jgi:hypothetical protein
VAACAAVAQELSNITPNCTVYLDKFFAVASSLRRLEVGLSVLTGVISQTRCPGSALKSKQSKAKVSHNLRPGNTAFKEQLKLVNGFER